MKKSILLSVPAALCLIFNLKAQPVALRPQAALTHQQTPLLLSNGSTVNLDRYKGKLLILDFWATWCSACLTNFPRMEALRKQFSDRIEILPVTYQSQAIIKQFFTTAAGKPFRTTSVTGDTLLHKLFPHQGIPYCVWIGPDQKVIAMTDAEEVTAEKINKVLMNSTTQLQAMKELDVYKPLFLTADYPVTDSILAYSVFSKGRFNGYGSGNVQRRSGKTVIGQACTNTNILWLYETAAINLFYKTGQDYSQKRRQVLVRDTTAITLNRLADGSYASDNLYNYDLIVPLNDAPRLYELMLSDLNRVSGYQGSIEKLPVKCLVLTRTDGRDKLQSAGGKRSNTLFAKEPFALTNMPVRNLIIDLENYDISPLPIIDATDYKNPIDLHLSNTKDLQVIRKELAAYGLVLEEQVIPIDMLVVRDRAPAPQ